MADGSILFFLRSQAGAGRYLQSPAETGLHLRDRTWDPIGSDWAGGLEAGAIFLAGSDDGRFPLGAAVAFSSHVGNPGFRAWSLDYGRPAWMEQLHVDAHGLEE